MDSFETLAKAKKSSEGIYPKKTDKKDEKEYGRSDASNKQLHKYSEVTRENITPYYYGEKLSLDQDLVADGFPAITTRVIASVSPQGIIDLKYEGEPNQSNYLIQRRNSFFDLHNPDLSRVDCRPKPSFEESEDFFRNYIIAYGLLHTSSFMFPFEGTSNDIKVITREREEMYKDEDIPRIIISKRTMQISDDDLDTAYVPHRIAADFCVTVGRFSKKVADSRSKAQIVRWAESVIDHESVEADELIKTNESEKREAVNIKLSGGAIAVRSIHSVGSYNAIGNDKDGIFDITDIKTIPSHHDTVKFSSMKTLSFASVHSTPSGENVTIQPEN